MENVDNINETIQKLRETVILAWLEGYEAANSEGKKSWKDSEAKQILDNLTSNKVSLKYTCFYEKSE